MSRGQAGIPKTPSGERACENCGEKILLYPFVRLQRWCDRNCRNQFHIARGICYRCRKRKISKATRGNLCKGCAEYTRAANSASRDRRRG